MRRKLCCSKKLLLFCISCELLFILLVLFFLSSSNNVWLQTFFSFHVKFGTEGSLSAYSFLNNRNRCREIRRRISFGVLDYATREGDTELVQLLTPLFTERPLVVWSADHHMAPIADLRSIFEPLGVRFIEHTLYMPNRCAILCTCDQIGSVKVLNDKNILDPKPEVLEQFWNVYRDDREMQNVDAFLVTYAIPLVEVFARFNSSIITVPALRYERTLWGDKERWKALNKRIRKLFTNPRNEVGANNIYDQQYVKYFTGIEPHYIPSFCAYTGERYNPTRSSYLYARRVYQPVGAYWTAPFQQHYARVNATFKLFELRELYEVFEFADLCAHLGLVYLPYQVSIMMFFELYRMDIPLFAPSLELLTRLHYEHLLVYDRTLAYMERLNGSAIPAHPSQKMTPDPNNDYDADKLRHWLSFSDFFTFPSVSYFESAERLIDTLESTTLDRLKEISDSMHKFNVKSLKIILRYWRSKLLLIAQYSPHRPH